MSWSMITQSQPPWVKSARWRQVVLLVCLLLFTDCGAEKGDSSVFLDSIFDIFEDCGLGGSVSQEQQQLIRELLLDNITTSPFLLYY